MDRITLWECPEHGVLDPSSTMGLTGHRDVFCAHDHDEPQQVASVEVVPAADLGEARAAQRQAERDRDRWKDLLTDARLERAELERANAAVMPPAQIQDDDAHERADHDRLVAEARAAQQAAERDRDHWKRRFTDARLERADTERSASATSRSEHDLATELRTRRQQITELDTLARDVALFLASVDVSQDAARDAQRRDLIRSLRRAVT